MSVCSYGAAIVSLEVPNRDGQKIDVVLGFDKAEHYVQSIDLPAPPHFGAAIGRYAGRIGRGLLNFDGREIQLRPNSHGHTLHGGRWGYSQRVWTVTGFDKNSFIELTLNSPDGDENFPGTLDVRVRYELAGMSLRVLFTADVRDDTVLNLTQHSYFNLDGHMHTVAGQKVCVRSDAVLETLHMVPTGKILAAEDMAMNLSEMRMVPHEIDATFVLNREEGPAAQLVSAKTGISLEVHTNQPSVHVYVGGNCFGQIPGKNGASYHAQSGICFETQNYPDAPNHPHFPSAVVRAGETYRHETTFQFKNIDP